jgi:hypothetical protein
LWSHRSSCPDDGPKRENYPRKSGKIWNNLQLKYLKRDISCCSLNIFSIELRWFMSISEDGPWSELSRNADIMCGLLFVSLWLHLYT